MHTSSDSGCDAHQRCSSGAQRVSREAERSPPGLKHFVAIGREASASGPIVKFRAPRERSRIVLGAGHGLRFLCVDARSVRRLFGGDMAVFAEMEAFLHPAMIRPAPPGPLFHSAQPRPRVSPTLGGEVSLQPVSLLILAGVGARRSSRKPAS